MSCPEPEPSRGQWHRINASHPCIASMHRINASHPWPESLHPIDGPGQWVELNGPNRRMTTMHRKQWTEPNGPKSRKQTSDSHPEVDTISWNNESTQRTGSKDRIKQSPQRFASASGIGEDPRNRITEPEPHQCTEPPAKLVKESGGSPSISRSD